MDLAQIGAHCSLSSCNILDFLPIICKCETVYCSQHINPDRHDCPLLKASMASELSTFEDQLRRCDVDGCKKLSLRSASSNTDETCSACSKSFCVECVHISQTVQPTHVLNNAQDIDTQNRISAHPFANLPMQPQKQIGNPRRLSTSQRGLQSLLPTLLGWLNGVNWK